MNVIMEITSKAAILPPAKQRAALALIEELLTQTANGDDEAPRENREPLKGATARVGKSSVSEDEIAAARGEMWSKFTDENE